MLFARLLGVKCVRGMHHGRYAKYASQYYFGVFISTKGEATISFVDNRISDFRGFYMQLYRIWFLGFCKENTQLIWWILGGLFGKG